MSGREHQGSDESDLAGAVESWRKVHADRPGMTVSDSDQTPSGHVIEPVYTPVNSPSGGEDQYLEQLGLPGAEPFTRGIRPAMYRDTLWVMGQYSGKSTPSETNRRIRDLLANGQRGFSIALDLPTQNGYDSDHELAAGEVGRVGVPIDSLRDMEALLEGIDLGSVAQIRTTANAIGPIALALFVVAAENKGVSPTSFKVLFQNDVLKEYVGRGTYIFPPERGLKFSVDVIEYCARNLPGWEPIEFCGYHIRDSGGTPVQELGVALANGIEYIDASLARGLTIDEFAGSVYMFLSSHLEILEEVAKFRAARRMWSRLMTDRYDAKEPTTKALKIFCYTLGGALSAQQPMNNVVRVAYQSLAAVLGGVQTLATSSYDEALGIPTDASAKLALRTQQILAHETGVVRTADPLGGSYYVEKLTDDLEEKVGAYLDRLTELGGVLEAIDSGDLQVELGREAYRLQLAVEAGERTMVGVNRFVEDDDEAAAPSSSGDSRTAESDQIRRLLELRESRDQARVDRALSDVRHSAEIDANSIPSIIEAVRSYATVGEICEVLTDVWGRYRGSARLA